MTSHSMKLKEAKFHLSCFGDAVKSSLGDSDYRLSLRDIAGFASLIIDSFRDRGEGDGREDVEFERGLSADNEMGVIKWRAWAGGDDEPRKRMESLSEVHRTQSMSALSAYDIAIVPDDNEWWWFSPSVRVVSVTVEESRLARWGAVKFRETGPRISWEKAAYGQRYIKVRTLKSYRRLVMKEVLCTMIKHPIRGFSAEIQL